MTRTRLRTKRKKELRNNIETNEKQKYQIIFLNICEWLNKPQETNRK